ncbi:MAG TPA: cytochrome c oxidase subunit 3 [Kouleothrix sp.]|uniref:cytochrome c oxidase subunit 3 n=1 Tax=Kouleothrix sp. TaxID=2779161 RepID=UPI002C6A3C01|nr:cytochrome c oxidase subunit 3 [Kouleothrix sp.]HRC75498.1 cytochrome c oxidase subunit 3 [Kouleothrix sp.]
MSETRGLVAHHFDDAEQQHMSSYLGMWIFLATEVMFLGGLFAAFAVYRYSYAEAFREASRHLYASLGALNTAVLLCSSLTMALAVRAAALGRRGWLVGLLAATMLLGLGFLGIKATEYYLDFQEHLVPLRGFGFAYEGADPRRAQLFFDFYFAMTGLHALHMLIAIGWVGVVALLAWRGRFSAAYSTPVEVAGLFWHFVDIVWVFLFPVLYLVG